MKGQKLFVLKQDNPAEVQHTNISSILRLTQILKSCLGPKCYQKMLLTKTGLVEITSDGNSILRELDTSHCATRMLCDLSRCQDVVGDGTTSVSVLAGELLREMQPLLSYNPNSLSAMLRSFLPELLGFLDANSFYVKKEFFTSIVRVCLQTKLCSMFELDLATIACDVCEILSGSPVKEDWRHKYINSPGSLMSAKKAPSSPNFQDNLHVQSGDDKAELQKVDPHEKISGAPTNNNSNTSEMSLPEGMLSTTPIPNQPFSFDKSMLRVEKIPGDILQTRVISGCVINKTAFHPGMRAYIENPRIILIKTGLEYQRNESQTHFHFTQESQFAEALQAEEQLIRKSVETILALKPDVVCCAKGISDLALGIFVQNEVTALRRFKPTDLQRIAKCSNAQIVYSPSMLTQSSVGTQCSLFSMTRIASESYCCFEGPKVATVLVRGPMSYAREIERNLQDALGVAKCLFENNKVVVGGGSIEYFLSRQILSGKVSIEKSTPSSPMNERKDDDTQNSSSDSQGEANMCVKVGKSFDVFDSLKNTASSVTNFCPKLAKKHPESIRLGQLLYIPKPTQMFLKKPHASDLMRQKIIKAVSNALRTIPILLANNAGACHLRALEDLRLRYDEFMVEAGSITKKPKKNFTFGVDGCSGGVRDMKRIVVEPLQVKVQAIKSIIDTVSLLLRVDGVIHGGKDTNRSSD